MRDEREMMREREMIERERARILETPLSPEERWVRENLC
jgi:hypothetical protein